MNAPRKPVVPVDLQLELFETSLRSHLTRQLWESINHAYWAEVDYLNPQVRDAIWTAVDRALEPFCEQYALVSAVTDLLEHFRMLIRNVVWAAMNVPYPADPWHHMQVVLDNAHDVYNQVIYAPLRTEMIMANHNAEVLQRTWRRCITDPEHPACRRRLEFEFEEFAKNPSCPGLARAGSA